MDEAKREGDFDHVPSTREIVTMVPGSEPVITEEGDRLAPPVKKGPGRPRKWNKVPIEAAPPPPTLRAQPRIPFSVATPTLVEEVHPPNMNVTRMNENVTLGELRQRYLDSIFEHNEAIDLLNKKIESLELIATDIGEMLS